MFGPKMHFYSVYANPSAKAPEGKWKCVPEGFSWIAFFVPLFWALHHRMWALAALVFVYYGAVGLAFGEGPGAAVLQLGLHLFVGLSAADIEDYSLRRRGHQFEGVVAATNAERGLQRFLDRKTAHA